MSKIVVSVRVPNKHLHVAVQKMAFDLGYNWANGDKIVRESMNKSIQFWYDGSITHSDREDWSDPDLPTELLTVSEFVNRLQEFKFKPEPPPIIIADRYKVRNFTKDGFEVGCTHVTWDQYDEIGKRRKQITQGEG